MTATATTTTATSATSLGSEMPARPRRATRRQADSATAIQVSAQLGVAVDQLARLAGLTAALTAVLGAAGILATVSYLSAWAVPTPIITLDPVTAALRSELVFYQVVLVWLLVFGLDATARYVHGRRRIGQAAVLGTITLALGVLLYQAISIGFVGQVLAVGGGTAIFLAVRLGYLRGRSTAIAFAAVVLVSSIQTGAEMGARTRDRGEWQTPLTLSVRTPVGGLTGAEAGGGWQYGGLYLVFRDGESIYVSLSGAGQVVWVVPESNIMGIGIGR